MELKRLEQWVCWKKAETPKGKTTKIPINAKTLKNAQSNNKETWSSFNTAFDAYERYNLDGIGFMFDNGYFGVDLDDCDDELKSEFVNTLQSYTEISQSGNGIHIICKGKLPEGQRRKGNVEMYDTGRFFVMTGNMIGDYPIKDCEDTILYLFNKYLAVKKDKPKFQPTTANIFLDDTEIIKKASDSKNGVVFSSLYAGNYEHLYQSQSEADYALCSMLAFWTNCDENQIDRIFRSSGLMREKWERKTGQSTYGEITVSNACKSCINTYNPKYKNDEVEMVMNAQTGEIIIKNKKKYDLNDTGNAKRLFDTYGDNLKYNVENKNWVIWNGKYWESDVKMSIKLLAEQISEDMKKEAEKETNEEVKKQLLKNINKALNSAGKEAMIKELQHSENIPCKNNEFDKITNLLNIEDGVLDLKTGQLLPHKRELMLSKISNIKINNKKPELWLKFLNEIFLGDKELISFIQKAIGYTLTGMTKEQCLFICFGDGANGKTVFLDILASLLGEYSATAQIDSLLVSKNNQNTINSDIARLKGVRFVTTAEPSENAKLNEGLIKQLTGGDKITARFLYGREFEFKPELKLWIATNHKPIIRGTDNGIWRRIRLIPFNATFTKEQQDKNLTQKLMIELPQIMSWAVDGCTKWFNEGLETPKIIDNISTEYKKEMDVVNTFIDDCVVKIENSRVKANVMFSKYVDWARKNNEYEMSNTKFGRELAKRFDKVKVADGVYYLNVGLQKGDGYTYEKQ